MLVWFNKKGVLKEQLDSYGNFPRVGSEDFKIYAYFEDLNYETFDAAYIRLERPDFAGSRYPMIDMRLVYLDYQDGVSDTPSILFSPGGGPGPNGTYPCYLFDFGTIKDVADEDDIEDDVIITLLDTPGLWRATITLVANSSLLNVVGTMTFNVEGNEGPEEENELDPSVVIERLIVALAKKLNIRNGIVVLEHLSDAISGYTEGQIFYIEETRLFYQLQSGELVEYDIFNPNNSYVTVEEEQFVIPPEDR